MAEEKDAFYVVRKGDVVGIYKSFSDIQPSLASFVSSDPVSIYKGYSLPPKTEEYLVSPADCKFLSCNLHFDGASKGNPGPAGAGAMLRDGSKIQGLWKIKNQNMGTLCGEAKELKDKFLSFKISHIPREYNSEADAQANLAINLRAGEVQEDCQLL
ncbi:hypothetical protein glysoja_041434 [Glycine soja]|uniref:RNase H type-1 domain-containing protein n=1 Tax=Glycine soja TaxID=3848 RepID=A0A0B2Q507_GLYSO|nr:hypothetical protein glysoja_041434 [Glycine soja]